MDQQQLAEAELQRVAGERELNSSPILKVIFFLFAIMAVLHFVGGPSPAEKEAQKKTVPASAKQAPKSK